MSKRILVVFSASPDSVRLSKEASFFKSKGYTLSYIGWSRNAKNIAPDPRYETIETLMSGGGKSIKMLPLRYIVFIIKLFTKLILKRNLSSWTVFAVNFESAFAVWLVSYFRKVNYIYDIWDEFAISHNFPVYLVKLLRYIDKCIRRKSSFYIHVDENRISEIDGNNYVIIYNSPLDFFHGNTVEINYDNSFAVTGWLNETRGLLSIYNFAFNNPGIKFIVAGGFRQEEYKRKFLALPNVEYHSFMPQKDLFKLINSCRGIFSLYDTSIPINRLAASNKLYDSMMLSVPVIVNKDLQVADFVQSNKIGYLVDYNYNESWKQLEVMDCDSVKMMGANGRKIYLDNFEFSAMMENVFVAAYNEYIVD